MTDPAFPRGHAVWARVARLVVDTGDGLIVVVCNVSPEVAVDPRFVIAPA